MHYKAPNNSLHLIDSVEYEHLLPAGSVQITDAEAANIRAVVQAEAQASRTYTEKRAAEYPPFNDYLDGVVKGDQAQIDKYISDCLAVKAKYPKVTA
jgi:hypothetical protein